MGSAGLVSVTGSCAGSDVSGGSAGFAAQPALYFHICNSLDAPLDVVAEGQGRARARAPPGGEVQKRLGVVGLRVRAKASYRRLVAAVLHVPQGEPPGQPNERVEPVDAEREIRERLYDVVAPPDMAALVGEDAVALPLRQPLRQVYPRAEYARREGGAYVF